GSDVYVVNSLSNSILKYDIDGFSILNEFSTGNGTNPFKMVIADDRIYVSAYLTHQLLIFNLSGGLLENIDLAVLEEGGKTFYPFPQGIATWGDYVFIACMYSEENSAAKTMDPGRVAVYSIPDQNITGYIEASAQNTSAVNIDGDVLYVISSGAYDPDSDGYDESGKIETLDLSAADLSNDLANPAALSLTTMTSGQSFGALEINNDRAWASDLGNGTLYSYDASATPWVEIANQSFPGSFGMAFVPDIVYDAARDELLATEFNGNILYTLDPDSLEKLDEQRVSGNSMDAQFMLLVE
ncbi:MAG: hypothetical protein D6B26_07175, partial [Spirochaetaceae bacterium]